LPQHIPYEFFTHDLFKLYASRCPIYQRVMRRKVSTEVMSTQEVFVQQFARLFHHYREALSPEADRRTHHGGSVPCDERNRLVAAARLAILELEANARMADDSRKYFAKPGEAEWGC
jgi:hypothetical protein